MKNMVNTNFFTRVQDWVKCYLELESPDNAFSALDATTRDRLAFISARMLFNNADLLVNW